ncbi:Transcriptional regulator containing an amidase domain and an AraC-type DNA-binding HTH domain [Pseudomonas sp. R4-35-07]|nr:Transcriptional regulator containing an amidase domain and an AraC-type DNA-binding HTH domain [Pseudomonas sp. R3-52-08]AZF26765.1 Transcriptional regulator containing an amidase domain and an AraC-type DNA-binding HTH domain [Pseudomonas sp. R2-60-08W]AZF32116.1 Transcriptional regulator containing an amidase domain and an AraC-type DNA-binding HTH domain [Pseudomonas sp. R4-35-07]
MEFALKKIVLVAFDHFTDIDLFLMWDILGRNTEDWHVRIVGASPIVRSAHGLPVSVHGPLREANSADAVLFVSGKQGIPAALAAPDFLPVFELDPKRQRIGAICAGAFILERLGLLNGLATTHPDARSHLQALGIECMDRPLVFQGNVATAGGCLSALYLVGWLVESWFDVDKRRATLLPVLPTGQQALYDALIGLSIRQGEVGTLTTSR